MQDTVTYNINTLPTITKKRYNSSQESVSHCTIRTYTPLVAQLLAAPKGRERRLFAKKEYRYTTDKTYRNIQKMTNVTVKGNRVDYII